MIVFSSLNLCLVFFIDLQPTKLDAHVVRAIDLNNSMSMNLQQQYRLCPKWYQAVQMRPNWRTKSLDNSSRNSSPSNRKVRMVHVCYQHTLIHQFALNLFTATLVSVICICAYQIDDYAYFIMCYLLFLCMISIKLPFHPYRYYDPVKINQLYWKWSLDKHLKRKITNRGQSPVLNQDKIIEKKRPKNWFILYVEKLLLLWSIFFSSLFFSFSFHNEYFQKKETYDNFFILVMVLLCISC